MTYEGTSGVRTMWGQIHLDKPEFPTDIILESNHAKAKWIRQHANLFSSLDILSATAPFSWKWSDFLFNTHYYTFGIFKRGALSINDNK